MPIGKHDRFTRGDFSCACDDCGVMWQRSELERKADGLLYCPDCVDGRDTVTLNEGNARAAEAIQTQQRVYSGGQFPKDDYSGAGDVATVVGSVTFGRQGFGGG